MRAEHRVPTLYFGSSVRRVARPFLIVALLAGLSLVNARGEDRPRELPMDGAWVRYQMEFKRENQDAITVIITVSFVGTVDENRHRYRWVEVKENEPQATERLSRVKILVPETDLLESERPFENAVRLVSRNADGKLRKLDRSTSKQSWDRSDPLFLWTPGMLKRSVLSDDDAKDIDYQQGTLKGARARNGKRSYVRRGVIARTRDAQTKESYTVWLHPDLRYGYAEAQVTTEDFAGETSFGKLVRTYRILDIGTDAKSEILDDD